jgi:hypothetical protein
MTTGWIALTVLLDVGVTAIVAGVMILVPWRADREVREMRRQQQSKVAMSVFEATTGIAPVAATA